MAAMLLGLAPHSLFHHRFDVAFPDYLVLFALGMAGAEVGFSARPAARLWQRSVPWGLLALCLVCLVIIISVGAHALAVAGVGSLFCVIAACVGRARWQSVLVIALPTLLYLVSIYPPDVIGYGCAVDILIGASAVCFLLAVTGLRSGETARPNRVVFWIVAALEWRPLVAVGTFSYSLYLVHRPLILLAHQAMTALALVPAMTLALNLFLVIPLCLPICYLFFLAFERPFLVQRKRETVSEVARDAALSPAT